MTGSAGAASEPIRVLVVDDLPNTRDWWVRFLGSHGMEAKATGTLYDALRELRRPPGYDAVVADLHLAGPGRADGGDLLTAVARWHPGVKARILMTADPLGGPMAESLGAEWFDKDRDPVELVMLLRWAVARA